MIVIKIDKNELILVGSYEYINYQEKQSLNLNKIKRDEL